MDITPAAFVKSIASDLRKFHEDLDSIVDAPVKIAELATIAGLLLDELEGSRDWNLGHLSFIKVYV